MHYNFAACDELMKELEPKFIEIRRLFSEIRTKLQNHADGKTLKGDEIVAWLGEIYCRQITGGRLVLDDLEHDVITPSGDRISVKTRKGNNSGWKVTSAIPKIDIDDHSPTHLMFIHLYDDYSIQDIWLFPWEDLLNSDRFKVHNVRGSKRSYQVRINEKNDSKYLIYKSWN